MTRPTRIAVAATNALAVQAGLALAKSGGSAVDAAIATMLVTSVTEPGVISPLGGAFVNVWPAGGEPILIDGNVEMPGRGLPRERFGGGVRELFTEYAGGLTVFVGHGSAATPGAFAAMGLAHERYGRAPWAEVVAPAVAAARDGYPLGASAASYLSVTGDSIFGWDQQTRAAISRPDGTIAAAGDRITSPDLAASMEIIAAEGPSSIYTGELADRMTKDMEQNGGLVTRDDLAQYRAVEREPLRVRLGEWSMAINPPPSVGGPVLTALLRLWTERDPAGGSLDDLVAIQRRVLDYRRSHLDVAHDLGAAGRELLELVRTAGALGLPTSASTAHVSVTDADGVACAITASAGYGSGATVPGTGLMLNNCLGEPELNRLGLHALRPGTRLASNMAPTTAVRDDGARLAIGTPGADRITTTLMQVLDGFCLRGLDLQEAIDRRRLHVRLLADGSWRVDHEVDPALAVAAARSGLPSYEHPPGLSLYFGGVGAALLGPDRRLSAAADPRREAAIGAS